jgi:hypothetical protein
MIRAIRITAAGQRAIQYLAAQEAPSKQKVHPSNPQADKLSNRKSIILAVCANGRWLTIGDLLRRLKTTEDFADLRKADANKLTDELIALSADSLLQLGRQEPQACHDCGQTPARLYATVTLSNDSFDGNEAAVLSQTPPKCKECYERANV